MSCPNHPDAAADQTCASCRKSFCRDCVVEIAGQSYCAQCKEELVRELKSGVTQGPELATRLSRLAAQMIDGLILMVGLLVILGLGLVATSLSSHVGDDGLLHETSAEQIAGVAALLAGYAVFFAGAFVYEWKMVAATGQTLGKRALNIQVISDDGRPLGDHAWKRPMWRYIFTFMSCLGFIDPLMIFSERNRTLHDRLAKTLVIRSRR